jgi:hypothetical protein
MTQNGTSNPYGRPDRSGGLNAQTRAVIEVVLEALHIPHAATVGDDEVRQRILNERLMWTVASLRDLVADHDYAIAITAALAYLRERLAEHPPVGYVTSEQAHERLNQGLSWPQPVNRIEGEATR